MNIAVRSTVLVVLALLIAMSACADDASFTQTPPASVESASSTPAPTLTSLEQEELAARVFGPFGEHRTALSFCFDSADGLEPSNANAVLVRQARDSVITNLRGDAWYFDSLFHAQIVPGCPPSTVPLGSEIVSRSAASDYHVRVAVAGEHRVFVYFVSEETYAVTFGDAPYFEAAAEICCMTGNDAEVTTAVYVTPAISSARLGEALMHAIGFRFYCAPGEVCPTRGPT